METNKIKILKEELVERSKPYIGMNQEQLKAEFGILSTAKSINSMIVNKMIDVERMHPELVKLFKERFVFKTVVTNKNGQVTQSMSFPAINYEDMITNNWEDSETYVYFVQKNICLFVFENTNGTITFSSLKFLQLTDVDIYNILLVWEKTKNLIINDKLILGGKYGYSVENFPSKSENNVAHIRPHDSDSQRGKVFLPNGKKTIKYCFWLNNKFIERKIK